jgi:hypothetical protein
MWSRLIPASLAFVTFDDLFFTLKFEYSVSWAPSIFPSYQSEECCSYSQICRGTAWCHVDMNGTTVGSNVIAYTEGLCLVRVTNNGRYD